MLLHILIFSYSHSQTKGKNVKHRLTTRQWCIRCLFLCLNIKFDTLPILWQFFEKRCGLGRVRWRKVRLKNAYKKLRNLWISALFSQLSHYGNPKIISNGQIDLLNLRKKMGAATHGHYSHKVIEWNLMLESMLKFPELIRENND